MMTVGNSQERVGQLNYMIIIRARPQVQYNEPALKNVRRSKMILDRIGIRQTMHNILALQVMRDVVA